MSEHLTSGFPPAAKPGGSLDPENAPATIERNYVLSSEHMPGRLRASQASQGDGGTTPKTRERTVANNLGLSIDRSSPVPLYHQVVQGIEAAIYSGVLEPGSRLDNEIDLAAQLNLSRP